MIDFSFYDITVVWNDFHYFIPMFLLDIVLYIPTVTGYGALVVLVPFLSNYMATFLQYIQLRLQMLNLEEEAESDGKRNHQYLKQICFDHKNAIRLSHIMNKTFHLIYLSKLLIYSVFYCILFFIFTLVDDRIILFNSLNLVVCFQLESWFISYYGNKLMTEVSSFTKFSFKISINFP